MKPEQKKEPNWRLVFWGMAVAPLMIAIDAALKGEWSDVLFGSMLCLLFAQQARGKG